MENSTTKNASEPVGLCHSIVCMFSRGELDFIAFSLFAIAAISLLGNIPILIVTLCSSKRRNSSNVSTLSLAVSDLLITIFCIPFVTLDLFIYDTWIVGPTMCRLVTFVQNTAILASMLNLLTITCEKFLAVRFPFNVRLRKKLVLLFLPVAWITAATSSAVYVQYMKLAPIGENKFYCTEHWPDTSTRRTIKTVLLTFFFVPLFVISTLHSITICTLVKGKRALQFQLNKNERDSLRRVLVKHRRQRKAVKIILVTLISIIICWSPMYFFHLYVMVFPPTSSERGLTAGYTACVWLLFSHCCVFPLIYFFLTHKGKETIALCSLCLKNCGLRGTTMLLDSSNHGGSTRTTARYSSWRRSSTPGAETRL